MNHKTSLYFTQQLKQPRIGSFTTQWLGEPLFWPFAGLKREVLSIGFTVQNVFRGHVAPHPSQRKKNRSAPFIAAIISLRHCWDWVENEQLTSNTACPPHTRQSPVSADLFSTVQFNYCGFMHRGVTWEDYRQTQTNQTPDPVPIPRRFVAITAIAPVFHTMRQENGDRVGVGARNGA